MLLLSCGFQGSRTLFAQMTRVLGQHAFRQYDAEVVRRTVAHGCVEILQYAMQHDIEVDQDRAKVVLKAFPSWEEEMALQPVAVGEAVQFLLTEDKGVQKAFSHVLAHHDSVTLTYSRGLFEHARGIISDADFQLTTAMHLQGRALTTGIVRETCELAGVSCQVTLAGGQRSERRKWPHVMPQDNVALLVYQFRLCGYCEVYVHAARSALAPVSVTRVVRGDLWPGCMKMKPFVHGRSSFNFGTSCLPRI